MKVENVNLKSGNWSVDVDENIIRLENKLNTVKLFINDKMQDVYFGMFGAPHLTGKLPNGKEVKAVIGGDLKMHCCIFVDNEMVLED